MRNSNWKERGDAVFAGTYSRFPAAMVRGKVFELGSVPDLLAKLCMNCGTTHDMPLNKRVFKCGCGVEENRDIHAAQNILSKAYIEIAA